MSWEEMSRREYPCECGKGTYVEVVEMDDWNRRKDYIIIKCPECAERERIAEHERERKEAKERAHLKELVKEINTYFEEHYMEDWIAYFSSAKSKKEVWTLAKKIGVESFSLSSFYKYNQGASIEECVRVFAKAYNMGKIIEVLNIDDSYFKSKVDELLKIKGNSPIVIGFY